MQEIRMNSVKIAPPLKLMALACASLAAACASEPIGPTVQVYPAQNKPFEVFQQEQEANEKMAAEGKDKLRTILLLGPLSR